MCAKITNGCKDICPARYTLAKELLNAILNSVSHRLTQNLFYTAAADFAPRWWRRAYRKWVTPMWNRWMAAGKAGATQAFPQRGASNKAILFVPLGPPVWNASFASELGTPTTSNLKALKA